MEKTPLIQPPLLYPLFATSKYGSSQPINHGITRYEYLDIQRHYRSNQLNKNIVWVPFALLGAAFLVAIVVGMFGVAFNVGKLHEEQRQASVLTQSLSGANRDYVLETISTGLPLNVHVPQGKH